MKIDKGSFINDFIDKNLRQYSIPVYQRNYEWSAEQCEKLFEDILQAHELDRYHFTGSVVYSLLKTENKIDYYVIIDGQQRLTTIYILIKALIDVAETDSEKETLTSVLFNVDKFKKYNIDDSSKLKLKPIKSDNKQLLYLMENQIEKMDKSSGIYKNYDLFCRLIKDALEEDENLSIERIYDGIEHLSCAMIKLEEEEKGKEQEIFERINSTGVPLNLADKIRNFVLMTEIDQERLYEEYWLVMEQLLGNEYLSGFFLDYLNFKLDGFTREKEAYDNFKALFKEENFTNETMLRYANLYHTLGNMVLVPKRFNSGRYKKTFDFWDSSLVWLKSNGYSYGNQLMFNKSDFTKYINYFFLWDYVECVNGEYRIKPLFNSHKNIEMGNADNTSLWSNIDDELNLKQFLRNACKNIKRRGVFMSILIRLKGSCNSNLNSLADDYFNIIQGDFINEVHTDGYNDALMILLRLLDNYSDEVIKDAKAELLKLLDE